MPSSRQSKRFSAFPHVPRFLMTAAAACLLAPCLAVAQPMELTTPDGRRVLLKENQTWEFIDTPAAVTEADETAPLLLLSQKDVAKGCRFGLRLSNELGFEIKSIVPQFTAITESGISYQTVFQSFNDLKPTVSQYQEIEFRGIECAAIKELRVSGGDRCTMGDLTKFTPEKGVCLSHIRVLESDLLTFSK